METGIVVLLALTMSLYVHVRLMTPLPKCFGYKYYQVRIMKSYKSIEAIRNSFQDGSRGKQDSHLLVRENRKGCWSFKEENEIFSIFRTTEFDSNWDSFFSVLEDGNDYGWMITVYEIDNSENSLAYIFTPFLPFPSKTIFEERSFENINLFTKNLKNEKERI